MKKTETIKEFTINPISLDDLLEKNIPPTSWLIEGIFPTSCINVLAGYTTSYKTWLVLDMAICLATGSNWLDKFPVKQSNVLIIDEESGESMLKQRFLLMTEERGLNIKVLSYSSFKAGNSESIVKYCLENNINVVILDSLIRSHSSDENSSSEMSEVFKHFQAFKKSEIALIFIHHNRKTSKDNYNPRESMRGSSEILGFVDSGISVSLIDGKRQLKIIPVKSRISRELDPFLVGLPEKGSPMFKFEYLGPCENKDTKSKPQIAAEHIVALFQGNNNQEQCQKEIIDTIKPTNIGESSIKEAINNLITDNILQARQGPGNSQLYSLK